MNTAFIYCIKMNEQRNKNLQNQNLIGLLEPSYEVMKNDSFNENSNNWYNRVYLCYENVHHNQPNNSLPINGFKCYRYNSFKNADNAWKNNTNQLNKMNIRVTMIPICKWMPIILDKYILNWKLINIYWLGKHTLREGNNSNFK